MIKWAGVRSDELDLIVEHYPTRLFPSRKDEKDSVPGGSGDIVYPSDEAYSNYEQSYSVFIEADKNGLPFVAHKVAEWLLNNPGYHRLEDSYDPDTYRMARYNGGENFSNFFNIYGRGAITFDCCPQRWLKSGELERTLTNGQKLINPTNMKARPIFKISGSGAGIIKVNNNQLAISNIGSYVEIDIEKHKAYNGSTNRNSTITGTYENMRLGKESVISWTGGITSVSIIPRWWTI